MSGGRPRIAVVHDDPRATLSLKRALEAESGVEVLGARGSDAALRRVDNDNLAALLLHWPLPDGDAFDLLWRLADRPEHPPVIAFGRPWDLDDVRRLLQLGVAGILDEPLRTEDLARDLEALRDGYTAYSAATLVELHGLWLLEPDESLWVHEALGTWQSQMAGLAKQFRRRWLGTLDQRADALAQRLEAATDDPLTTSTLKALLGVIEEGEDQLEAMAHLYRLDARVLRRLLRRAARFAESLGGPAELATTTRHLVERLRVREQRTRSGLLTALQRAARIALKRDDPAAETALLDGLHRVLDLPRAVLRALSGDVRQRLSARLLLEEDEDSALDHVRWVVLVHLLPPGREVLATPDEAAALTRLLAPGGISADALVEGLCALNPDPVLRQIDLTALRHFAEPVDDSAQEAVLTLLAAGRVGGLIDQRRVRALLAAIDAKEPALIGPPTWRSVEVVLAEPDRRETSDLVLRLLFVTGARGSADAAVLSTAMHRLLEVVPEALDLVRFVLACHDAIARRLDPGRFIGLAAQPTGDASVLDGLDGRAFEEARIQAVLAEFEGLQETMPGLDLNAAARRMPKAAARPDDRLTVNEVMRLQVLAALLANQRTDEARIEILRASHSPDARPRGEEAVVLEALARELGDPHTTALIRRRIGLGEKPDAAVVRRALAEARVDAAFVAVQSLGDDTTDLPSLLCAVALALYEAGRGPEGAPLYRRALNVEPKRLNALFALARLELEGARLDAALRLALEVRRRAPHLTPGINLLAEVQAGLARL